MSPQVKKILFIVAIVVATVAVLVRLPDNIRKPILIT
jgi:hypothetical protein